MIHTSSAGQVGEIRFSGLAASANPWFDRFTVRFHRGPQALEVPGFYDGREYKVRYQLPEAGDWEYEALRQGEGNSFERGVVRCGEGKDLLEGGLRIHPDNPRRFGLNGEEPFFLLSYEANWLWALETRFPGTGRVGRFLQKIGSFGFNAVLMNAYAYDTSWCPGNTRENDYGPPGTLPWEGSPEEPDFTRFNPAFWDAMDRVVEAFQENRTILHLYFKVFNKLVRWPARGSREEEEYFRHILARYQAYSCMVWDFSKESYYESDQENLTKLMRQVRDLDAYGRLRTIHDYPGYYERPEAAELLDFHTAQQHHNFFASVLVEHTKREWPYLNAEFGYECGPGGISDVTYGYGQTPQTLIARAWETVMAGAYPAYYYTNTAWDIIDDEAEPPGYGFFRILATFFREHDFSRFRPYQDHCLWRSTFSMISGDARDPEEVIFFIDEHILVPEHLSPGRYEGEWVDIYSGETRPLDHRFSRPCADREEYTIYTIPFTAPKAVLYLKRRNDKEGDTKCPVPS